MRTQSETFTGVATGAPFIVGPGSKLLASSGIVTGADFDADLQVHVAGVWFGLGGLSLKGSFEDYNLDALAGNLPEQSVVRWSVSGSDIGTAELVLVADDLPQDRVI